MLDYKIRTLQQTKAAEPPTAVCLEQHKIPQCADIQCCVLREERNRAMGDIKCCVLKVERNRAMGDIQCCVLREERNRAMCHTER
jgi:hypothetical protein